MDYSKIINRSAAIVWQHKFLIVLGFLASLGSSSTSNFSGNGDGGGRTLSGPEQFPNFGWDLNDLEVSLIFTLVTIAIFVTLVVWAIATTARGGLIAGVDAIESGEKPSFTEAWQAGWQKVWTLLGIGLLPGLPGLILFVFGLLALVIYGNLYGIMSETAREAVGWTGFGVGGTLLLCLVGPVVLVLSILRNFAERACMLENLGVIAAYRRGAAVLMANLGEAIILFILQVVIGIVLALLLFLPGIFVALCCFLWPLFLVAQGAINAFISSLWTMAWRTWTLGSALDEKDPIKI